MNKARCKDIFLACLARVSPTQCEEIFQELQIEPGTLDFSEDYGRNKNVLLAEFKSALQEKEARGIANRLVQLIWEITDKKETPYRGGYLAGAKATIRILVESDKDFAREYKELSA